MQARPIRIQSSGSGLRGLPVVRQQFGEPGDRMGGDARQNILEPGVGINSHALTGGHETALYRCRVAALVAAKEDPVVAVMCM